MRRERYLKKRKLKKEREFIKKVDEHLEFIKKNYEEMRLYQKLRFYEIEKIAKEWWGEGKKK